MSMAAEITLPDEILEQIKARAAGVAKTVAGAATRSQTDLEETVRLHVVNALTEAVHNTLRLDADYLDGGGEHARAAALRGGESLRGQSVLSQSEQEEFEAAMREAAPALPPAVVSQASRIIVGLNELGLEYKVWPRNAAQWARAMESDRVTAVTEDVLREGLNFLMKSRADFELCEREIARQGGRLSAALGREGGGH